MECSGLGDDGVVGFPTDDVNRILECPRMTIVALFSLIAFSR
jgi:hypothetical protein